MISERELERVRSHCPCGNALHLVEHEIREGVMDGRGRAKRLIKRFWQALYFHAATDRGFCSARCSLFWHQYFTVPFAEHGAKRVLEASA